MKTLVALLALVALSGFASAGVTGHAEATANGETHTLDVLIDDSGNASILVDGQPLGAPNAPGLPALPPAPSPGVPSVPSPGVPSVPSLPALPTLP